MRLKQVREGELESLIVAVTGVQNAKVRFTDEADGSPIIASVVVMAKDDSEIDTKKIEQIKALMASAIKGLEPDYVSIVDNHGNAYT